MYVAAGLDPVSVIPLGTSGLSDSYATDDTTLILTSNGGKNKHYETLKGEFERSCTCVNVIRWRVLPQASVCVCFKVFKGGHISQAYFVNFVNNGQ